MGVIQNDNDSVWVVITAHNSCGIDVDSIKVCTIDDPIADFTVSDTVGCHILTVNVDTTGISTNGEYVWELFDQNGIVRHTINTLNASDTSFNLTNYSHDIDSTYTIKLTVGDPGTGCYHSYVSDTIEYLFRLMKSDYKGVVNIGNPEEIRIIDLAEKISSYIE